MNASTAIQQAMFAYRVALFSIQKGEVIDRGVKEGNL